MSRPLTSSQCDAFMEAHQKVQICTYGDKNNPRWEIFTASFNGRPENYLGDFPTRQASVTGYRKEYDPGWQQPAPEYNTEWALRMLIKHDLGIGRTYSGDMWYVSTPDNRTTDESLVIAVEKWIDEYADSPQPLKKENANLEHDVGWALQYAKDQCFEISYLKDTPGTICQIWGDTQNGKRSVFGVTLVAAVEKWIDKYATPGPEPTLLDILTEIVCQPRHKLVDRDGYWVHCDLMHRAYEAIEREKAKETNGDK